MSLNNTEVRLLSVPLTNDYKHTLYFANQTEQTNYFTGRTLSTMLDSNYQRKDNVIRWNKSFDELMSLVLDGENAPPNYVMYRNPNFGKKWYYAFITNMKYISDSVTEIYIETDVIQTWMFDYSVLPSFIEREHVDDDTIGLHTVPENLESGEYVCNAVVQNAELKETGLVLATTLDISNYTNQPNDWNATKEFKAAYGATYNGVYSGLKYFHIDSEGLQEVLKCLAYEGQDDGVYAIFYAPSIFFPLTEEVGERFNESELPSTESARTLIWTVQQKPTLYVNGYKVRNNKLLTFPYTYLTLDNGGGGAVQFHYEKFGGDKVQFAIYGVLTPGCSIRAIPYQYNGLSGYTNQAEGLNLSKYATCSWTTDAFTSWLAQNGVNVAIGAGSAVATAALGVAGAVAAPATGGASLAAATAIAGGVAAVSGQVASVYQHSMTPPQVGGNINGGDVATASKQVTFTAYDMSIKKEYAEIIDGYFDMFGYKCNKLKMPNTAHRKNWWYTKTIDAHITGSIPMHDLVKIKACYNNGITFWRNSWAIGNYSLPNEIV